MIDWEARLADLHHHLASEYQIQDRPAIEILLSALLPCPHTLPLWLVLETDWLRRECSSGWFAFGQDWVTSLSELRTMRPRYLDGQLREYSDEPQTSRLWIEPDFERLPRYRRRSPATGEHLERCLARCLRVRTPMPRIPRVVVDDEVFFRRLDTLRALTRSILEDRTGARPPRPPSFVPPPNFLAHAALLQKLAPWYPDRDQLVNALAALAVRHAWLHGRRETAAEDWAVLTRTATDSIPPWIHRALTCLETSRGEGSKVATVIAAMSLSPDHNPAGAPSAELRRLHQHGVLHWNTKGLTWSIAAGHASALAELLAGRAFTSAPVAVAP